MNCANFISLMKPKFEKYVPQGLKAYVIIVEDTLGDPPTTAYCKKWRDSHKLAATVLFDGKGVMKAYGGRMTTMVTNEKAVIVWKKQWADSLAETEAAIVKELAEPAAP